MTEGPVAGSSELASILAEQHEENNALPESAGQLGRWRLEEMGTAVEGRWSSFSEKCQKVR